jgi:DNA adenine methylase
MSTTADQEMKASGLVPWFGAKRSMAPVIVQEFGPHRTYWELFCGSMAVLLAKPVASMETVNDLHDDLLNLARCLQHREVGPRLYRRMRRVLMDEREHREAATRVRDELAPSQVHAVGLNPNRAFDYFVASWFGRNGVAGTKSNLRGIASFNVRYTNRGGSASKRWESVVHSIPAFRRRLRNVAILASDGIALCERIADDPGTVIYADPPYLKKGAEYIHDFDWLAHRRLAKALRRFERARVVVSYYDHPDLDAMYPGWTKRDVSVTKALVNQGRRDEEVQSKAPEVLLINGPSYAEAP